MEENQVMTDAQQEQVVNTQQEKTFTQSEVEEMFTKRIGREKAKLEKEFEERLNQLEEAQKLSQMNETQKAEYEYSKRLEELTKREQELQSKEQAYHKQQYKAEIERQLAERGLPNSLADMLVGMDAESSLAKMNQLQADMGLQINAQVEAKIKSSANTPVANDNDNKPITLDDIVSGAKVSHSELEKAILDALRQ